MSSLRLLFPHVRLTRIAMSHWMVATNKCRTAYSPIHVSSPDFRESGLIFKKLSILLQVINLASIFMKIFVFFVCWVR